MDWSWFTALPEPLQQTLSGAAGDVAATAAVGIFTAARSRLAARNFRKERQKSVQAAIAAALKDALLKILPALSDQPDHMRQYLDLFGRWLAHPAVIEELGKLVAPVPDAMPDVARLRTAFVELDFDPDQLTQPFATIVDILFDEFRASAAWDGDLQPAIALAAAQETNRRLAALAPLDLDALDRRYLAAVYKESNELPLADAQPDQPQPRLQRVFVDLRIHDAAPDVARIVARLGLIGDGEARFRAAVEKVLAEGEPGLRTASAKSTAGRADGLAWHEQIARLDGRQIDGLAEVLDVERDAVRRAVQNLSPLEMLAGLEKSQMVLLGAPGSGKSTVTRRIAGILAALGEPEFQKEWSEDEHAWADALLGLCERWLLPVRVVLSRWAQHLPDHEPCAADVIDECWRIYQKVARTESERSKEHFVQRFTADEPSVFILFDGLDEVTDEAQRRVLLQAMRAFLDTYRRVPVLVTCRVRTYKALHKAGDTVPLPSYELDLLAPDASTTFWTGGMPSWWRRSSGTTRKRNAAAANWPARSRTPSAASSARWRVHRCC